MGDTVSYHIPNMILLSAVGCRVIVLSVSLFGDLSLAINNNPHCIIRVFSTADGAEV